MSELMDNSSVAVVAVGHYGRRNERPTCHESRAIKGYPKMLKLGVDKINYSLADFMYCQEFCLFNFCLRYGVVPKGLITFLGFFFMQSGV